MSMSNIVLSLIFASIIHINLINCDGLFYLQRIPSSCMETTITITMDNTTIENCFIYSWQQIVELTTNYTTYRKPNTNDTFYAKMGALTVLGTIDNYDLDYHCPPTGYNGIGPGCSTQPDTHLVVLHINTFDNKLYSIDVILSGTPFPSPDTLVDNQPPFGTARHIFNSAIPIQSTGYLKVCKSNTSDRCPIANISTQKLPNPLPSNTGYGIFGYQVANFVTNSVWIMDDIHQLLIITAGTNYYYFNASGFYLYDYGSNACMWISACNYQCEAYNYNSRFLDYAGEWIITKKWGIESMKSVTVQAWIGNAIDAAGIFPIIMYIDNATGHYIGLDKLDANPAPKMGASYWYIAHDNTIIGESIVNFHPNVVDVGCVNQMSDWAGTINNCEIIMTANTIQRMIALLFVTYLLLI